MYTYKMSRYILSLVGECTCIVVLTYIKRLYAISIIPQIVNDIILRGIILNNLGYPVLLVYVYHQEVYVKIYVIRCQEV